jgi:hypothetical protein
MLDSGDFLWPGTRALVKYSGSILSFRFGERDGKVLQFLFKRWARHTQRLSLRRLQNERLWHGAGRPSDNVLMRKPARDTPQHKPVYAGHPASIHFLKSETRSLDQGSSGGIVPADTAP